MERARGRAACRGWEWPWGSSQPEGGDLRATMQPVHLEEISDEISGAADPLALGRKPRDGVAGNWAVTNDVEWLSVQWFVVQQ